MVVVGKAGQVLLIILALFWVALLAPVAIRRLRDGSADRSIDSFHAEHEVLSRQEYSVPPAHRLDRSDEGESQVTEDVRRPRLTVVHADDTYRSLETRSSWDEWSHDYDFDDEPPSRASNMNRYAQAYASVPNETTVTRNYEAPIRRRSMKSRRKMMFVRLVLGAVVLTVIAFVSGYALVTDVAVASWVCVVSFVALALYAVSQGYLNESSLGVRISLPRRLATVQPLYDVGTPQFSDEFSADYDEEIGDAWERQPLQRRALG
jgi:hypothetical protein